MRHAFLPLAVLLAASATAKAESYQCNSINYVPFTISAPGSYCLTGDLTSTATGTNAAITIAADHVQLDLNGHSLIGPGGSTGYGIYAIGHSDLSVRNGALRGFGYFGVFITDMLVGFPPAPIGASSRHEISGLRVEGANVGISLLGAFSSIHDNVVLDATQNGIWAGGYGAGVIVRGNRVFNTVAPSGATYSVFGIGVFGVGSVVQDNVVSTLRGPSGAAGIYAAGTATIVSHNRETDLGGAWSVYCTAITGASPTKVEGNINFMAPNASGDGLYGCNTPTGYANNNF
ncbi:right-handed parallel beta-helix repeat-containing protein [Dokdonella soli]|uniref:Right handed beta helix domain-containing protein n=1 Tax=Dokdonella soli TaxID=529810 RepID=A0ABN1IXN5_9GAMM